MARPGSSLVGQDIEGKCNVQKRCVVLFGLGTENLFFHINIAIVLLFQFFQLELSYLILFYERQVLTSSRVWPGLFGERNKDYTWFQFVRISWTQFACTLGAMLVFNYCLHSIYLFVDSRLRFASPLLLTIYTRHYHLLTLGYGCLESPVPQFIAGLTIFRTRLMCYSV